MRNKNTAMTLDEYFGGTSELVFWSFRYFLGRRSAATCDFAEKLARAWPLVQENHRGLIRRELEEAFKRDDELRLEAKLENRQPVYLPLGDDCDRHAWESVRRAFTQHESGK